MEKDRDKKVKTLWDRLPFIILVAAILLHLLVVAGLFALELPGHNRENYACDFFSLAQAGMDARYDAGVYNAYTNHPAIWGPEGFPFVLPPWMAYFIGLPLSYFTPPVAYTLFCILLEIALAGIALFCWRLGGKGKFGALAAALCFLATPQFMVLKEGQTDTFIALGAAMLLWGLYAGRNVLRNIGLGLLIAIKPLGLFAAIPLLLKKKTRLITVLSLSMFVIILLLAFLYTLMENPGFAYNQSKVTSYLNKSEPVFSSNIRIVDKDYFFQFARYLVVGRRQALENYFAFDMGLMNLFRVVGLPWGYFAGIILLVYFIITWRFRRHDLSFLAAAWLLLPLLVMPSAWETYFLLTLPVIALVAGKRRDLLPFVPGVLLLMPNLTWFLGAAVVTRYPLSNTLFIIALANLLVRNLALGWLIIMVWRLISQDKTQAPS